MLKKQKYLFSFYFVRIVMFMESYGLRYRLQKVILSISSYHRFFLGYLGTSDQIFPLLILNINY